MVTQEQVANDVTDDGLGKLIANVVHKRRTYPKRLLEDQKIKSAHEIRNLMEAKVDLNNDIRKLEMEVLCEEIKKLMSAIPKETSSTTMFEKAKSAKENLNQVKKLLKLARREGI